MKTNQELLFREQWPACLASIIEFYGEWELPDNRYELVKEQLAGLGQHAATNDIEKALRRLWDFDNRFYGELLGFSSADYEWAVYSLCYLCEEEDFIEHLLNIFVPLLGRYTQERLGTDFRVKVGRTFMDDVGHILWSMGSLIESEDHGLFDWHGSRNDLPVQRINEFLRFADISPLPHPDFPPSWVLLNFTNMQNPFASELEYLRDLQAFYRDRGYSIQS